MSDAKTFEMPPMPTGELMQLTPLVARVLAPNPSPFTYTGTQTYLIGTAELGVIDPGPAEEAHVAALMRAVGGRKVGAILVTHTHRDHSPAAARLREETGAPIIGCAPLAISDDGPRADAAFDFGYAPERILADGDRVTGEGWTLEAVATPGHTSNHLCYALLEEKALFTGDHIMGWSTSIVSPPDGDMAAYMRSMQRLVERDDGIYYPAHGDPITNPQQLARGMMGHRKHREGQILRQLRDHGPIAINDMVPVMYKGVDKALYPAAARSVLAHLLDLEARDMAERTDELWKLPA